LKRRWPGNVRELRNVIERALALAGPGPVLAEHIAPDESARLEDASLLDLPLNDARALFGLRYAKTAIERAQGSVKEAAKRAQVSKQTLYRAVLDGERAAGRLKDKS
jgi:DNA-binding NtrC family response regulator